MIERHQLIYEINVSNTNCKVGYFCKYFFISIANWTSVTHNYGQRRENRGSTGSDSPRTPTSTQSKLLK